MYLTSGLSTWAWTWGRPPLISLILVCVNTNSWLQLVKRKLPLINWHSLKKHVLGKELRPGPSFYYFNNRSHRQNLRSTPGQAEFIAKHFFKNFKPLVSVIQKPRIIWIHRLGSETGWISDSLRRTAIHCRKFKAEFQSIGRTRRSVDWMKLHEEKLRFRDFNPRNNHPELLRDCDSLRGIFKSFTWGCMHRGVFIKKTWLYAFSYAQLRISLVFCCSHPWFSSSLVFSLTAE